MERNNISRCFGGLRLEDLGERRPRTFLVNNFSFLYSTAAKTRRSVRFLVSCEAVFRLVTQRSSACAFGDQPKNGCEGDYGLSSEV